MVVLFQLGALHTRLGHGISVTRDVNVGSALFMCESVCGPSVINVSGVGQLGFSLTAFDQFLQETQSLLLLIAAMFLDSPRPVRAACNFVCWHVLVLAHLSRLPSGFDAALLGSSLSI